MRRLLNKDRHAVGDTAQVDPGTEVDGRRHLPHRAVRVADVDDVGGVVAAERVPVAGAILVGPRAGGRGGVETGVAEAARPGGTVDAVRNAAPAVPGEEAADPFDEHERGGSAVGNLA